MSCSRWRALVRMSPRISFCSRGDGPQLLVVHHFGEPDDAVQRRPQLVRNRGQKAALGFRSRAGRVQRARQLLVLAAELQGVLRHFAGGHGREIPLRHIEERPADPDHFPIRAADEALADLDRDARPVLEEELAFERFDFMGRGHPFEHGGAKARLLVGSHEIPRLAAENTVGRGFQKPRNLLVEPPDHTLGIGLFVRDGGPVEQVAEPALALP